MKNIRNFLVVTLVLLTATALFADNDSSRNNAPSTVSLSGTILDKATNETLPGVTIQLVDSDSKVYSDPDGAFSLTGLEPGEYKMKISCISYKERVISVDVTKSGQNTVSVQLESVEP